MALIQICLVFIVALEGSYVSTSNDHNLQIVKARLGENVTLKCVSEVNETQISVQWNKLNYPDETTNSRMSNNAGHLVIENLQITDAGLYECQAIFGDERVDPMRSQTISLEVEASNCTLRSYHASNYGNLTSNCTSNQTVPYNTKCSFECDDSSILLGRSMLTCGTNDTFDFPLPTCRGKNMYAVVHSRTADMGENVDMHCGISTPAEDTYNLYWYKYETKKTLLLYKTYAGELTTYFDRGYQIYNGTDLDLLIPFATKSDSGRYQCLLFSHVNLHQYPYDISLSVRGTCKMPTLAGALHTNTTTCRSEATIVEGTICHFYCQSNYKLVGQSATKCLVNGNLSEHVPSCKGTCKMPTLAGALHTNTTTCRSEATIVEGTICHFYCQSNYKLVGQSATKCLVNGTLSEHVPSCKEELKGCQTYSSWLIAISIGAALLVVGVICVCSIWKLRKWKKKHNSYGMSTVGGDRRL